MRVREEAGTIVDWSFSELRKKAENTSKINQLIKNRTTMTMRVCCWVSAE